MGDSLVGFHAGERAYFFYLFLFLLLASIGGTLIGTGVVDILELTKNCAIFFFLCFQFFETLPSLRAGLMFLAPIINRFH